MEMLVQMLPPPSFPHLQLMCTPRYHLIHSHSLISPPSSIPSELGGQQCIDLSILLLLPPQMLTLTPLTFLLLLPTLGSPSCTQHRTRPLHLPPALPPLSLLPLPLELPSSMAGQELHQHLQLMHCLLEQQVHCLLPVSCLHPKEQVLRMVGMIRQL